MISEKIKSSNNKREISQFYFWRNYAGNEIDLLEEKNGHLRAYEFKWKAKELKIPISFSKNYPQVEYYVVSRNNIIDFL
jgi:hypothetical protein